MEIPSITAIREDIVAALPGLGEVRFERGGIDELEIRAMVLNTWGVDLDPQMPISKLTIEDLAYFIERSLTNRLCQFEARES